MSFEANRHLFIEEAQELVALLEKKLMELEKSPKDGAVIQEIFRALHSLKGSGAMFGFDKLSRFAHVLENLFEELRNEKINLDHHKIEVSLQAIDCFAELINDRGCVDEDQLADELLLLDSSGSTKASLNSKRLDPAVVSEPSEHIFSINFVPHEDILHRGVKIESLFNSLASFGTLNLIPKISKITSLSTHEPTKLYVSWIMDLATNRSEAEIRAEFMFVEDYAEITINLLGTDSDGELKIPKLGEVLVNQGIIDAKDVTQIVKSQKSFGQLAVQTGKVTETDVFAALAEQNNLKSLNSARALQKEGRSIRVNTRKIDKLIDIVGELVVLNAMLEQEARQVSDSVFVGIGEQLGRLASELRETSMSIRMIPVKDLFMGFERLVRDMSKQLKKDVVLHLEGVNTELDKNVIEMLKDPLVHLIRNSMDHGIETIEERIQKGKSPRATIGLVAEQVGTHVDITISDDGRGLDLDKIRRRAVEKKLISPDITDKETIISMIFEPGFSTSSTTTELSGRGVGMDVVKKNIEHLRGQVLVESSKDLGTQIKLVLPMTLVIIDGLLVRVDGVNYIVPLSEVQECIDLPKARVQNENTMLIELRGTTIPCISLRKILKSEKRDVEDERVVIIQTTHSCMGLIVDAVLGRKQVVIKPLPKATKHMRHISGASILGDGTVALILDSLELAKNI